MFLKILKNKKGFTLTELIMVILLLGIMAVIGTPLPSPTGIGLEAASKKVALDIAYARNLASITGTNHGVSFTAFAPYFIYKQSLGTVINDPLTTKPFSENFSTFKNVHASSSLQVEFDTDGRPVLGAGQTITLTNGTTNKVITITSNTGLAIIN